MRWSDLWRQLFSRNRAFEGVVEGVDNELEITGAVTPISVDTGVAIVDGKKCESDAAETIAIPTPAVDTRVDIITLRKRGKGVEKL